MHRSKQHPRPPSLPCDFITTAHFSPSGSTALDPPAAKYLEERGVVPADFNTYGARRGNHEVMMRGTFANVKLENKLDRLMEFMMKQGGN